MQLFESFLVRRNICGIEQTGLNLFFKNLFEFCQSSPSVETIVEIIKTRYGTIQLPDDEFVAKNIRNHNAFNAACLEHVLIEYNNHLSNIEDIESYETREHIYPQTPNSDEWNFSDEDGAKILNTLPNILPVTKKHNSSLSNAPFSKKVESYEEHSMYAMTRAFAKKYKKWDVDKFNERAEEITEWFLDRFPNYFDK